MTCIIISLVTGGPFGTGLPLLGMSDAQEIIGFLFGRWVHAFVLVGFAASGCGVGHSQQARSVLDR